MNEWISALPSGTAGYSLSLSLSAIINSREGIISKFSISIVVNIIVFIGIIE